MTVPNTPAFIDFEASSLDLIASYPIEVGVCMPDGSLHSWLIAPHVLWRDWSESAEAIHGISLETLKQEGRQIQDVAHELNALIEGPVYCDAWTFDSFWLHRLFRSARAESAFTLESVSSILDASQVQQWPEVRQQVIASLGLPVHRAANDALILQETWRRVSLGDAHQPSSVRTARR
ncbi:3'-5' exonuclease [Marinobacter sp. 1Y8]